MRAMVLRRPGDPAKTATVELSDVPQPEPSDGEIVVRVNVCGVCRTDLDIVEGRLAAPHYPVIPGHQVVGRVVRVGRGVTGRRDGDRVGIAWINWACGVCHWCRTGFENLCPRFRSTGCDTDGGYAEFARVPAAFALDVPDDIDDEHAAPLLCAGAIGWRSLRHTGIRDGDPLGLSGFGASAHLVLQLARYKYPGSAIYVFARNAGEREFALRLGATWTGDIAEQPPEALAAIIDTTPAWKPVVQALRRLMPGGRLVINAIRKSNADRDELAGIDYATDLWMERVITSVANVTRTDVREMLAAAAESGIRPTVDVLPLESANAALDRMKSGGNIRGATVLGVNAD